MALAPDYLFTSERLGFRNWEPEDLEAFAGMNADREVMKYFPHPLSREESENALKQYQASFNERGYTYYVVEHLTTGEFMGFIGFKYQDFDAPHTPAVDIGWRLRREYWGQGFASEGALRCLKYAFDTLGLERVVSHCPAVNTPSERVMQKIGMQKQGEFHHPALENHPELAPCVWYEAKKA